jgi:hypothetical protein
LSELLSKKIWASKPAIGIVTSKKGRFRPNSVGHSSASSVIFVALFQHFPPIGVAEELGEIAARGPLQSRAPAVCVAGVFLKGKP